MLFKKIAVQLLVHFFGLCMSTHAYSQVSVKNNSTQTMSVEKITDINNRATNSNSNNCIYGYEMNASGNCEKYKQQSELKDQNRIIGLDPMPSSKKRSLEITLIKKHKAEIIQRCGLEESVSTKITGMEDKSKRSLYDTNEPWKWRPTWRITYKIDTGNIIFGEKQFTNKTCVIDKLDGSATWES